MKRIDSEWMVCVSDENEWVGWEQLVWVMRFGGGRIIFYFIGRHQRRNVDLIEDRSVD